MNNKISIHNLCLSIDRQPILKNVSLNIPTNKITVILGPSGCGKTTLLKSLNRLTDLIPGVQQSGEILLDGVNILNGNQDLVDIRQKMGLLAQRPYPLPMNIYKNITYGLRISGRRNRQFLDKRVEHYLKMVNLWDEVKDKLFENAFALSGGQQQRLCIARAIAIKPEVILMDEPASALDPIATNSLERLIVELRKNYTIVIVTHNIQQAARVSEYTAFLYLGELVEFNKTEKIFTMPKDKKTEEYVSGRFS